MTRITVGFSIHRPEVVDLSAPVMAEHDIIILEEPATPGFADMLRGELGVEEYLLATEYEYPAFSRRMCALLRELHSQGREILQIDPYMEILLSIQERFADGESPADLTPGSMEQRVHAAEKLWYGALLDYYQKAVGADFRVLVEALKFFGKADAARGRFRDDLRAQAIAHLAAERENAAIFVEAGYIHAHLLAALEKALARLAPHAEATPNYLMEDLVRRLTGRPAYEPGGPPLRSESQPGAGQGGMSPAMQQVLGPGDVLTVKYIYNPEYEGAEADLQAARSIIRIKILHKDEIEENAADYPHTRDEIEASDLVRELEYADCETLWPAIRRLPTPQAKALVRDYLHQRNGANGQASSG